MALWPMSRKSRQPYRANRSNSSPAPAVRARVAAAASAASSSQASIAAANAARALRAGGSLPSAAGFIRQRLSLFAWACDPLKLFTAHRSGSQRSAGGPARLARWAEWTTSTAWNLNPTVGRGGTFRTPASSRAASTSW